MAYTGVGGFTPKRRLSGKDIATMRVAKSAAVVLGIGDPVVFTGSGYQDTTLGQTNQYLPLVTHAVGSEGTPGSIAGYVLGIEPNRNNLTLNYSASANTDILQIAVASDDLVCWIPENGSPAALSGATLYGGGVQFVWTAASTTTGYSNVYIDSNTLTITLSSSQMQILQVAPLPGNAPGSAGTVWEVVATKTMVGSSQNTLI